MKKNRKHIASFFFGSLLLLPLVFIMLLQGLQFYLSHTADERMEERSIETLVVAEHKVEWKEKGREVTIDGKYFDLVSWSLQDGKYTFTGVFDEDETAVMELLGKQQVFWNSIIRLLLIGQSFAAIVILTVQFSCTSILSGNWSLFENRYKFLFNRIISPPPRL